MADHRRTPPREDITIEAVRGVARLSRQVEIALGDFQLTVSQFRVLDRLCGGSTAGRNLAEWLAVKPPSITALVDGLVARDLVERTSDSTDRRRVSHELTPEGRTLHGQAVSALSARLSHLLTFVADRADDDEPIEALATWNEAIIRAADAKRAAADEADAT